MAGTPFQILRRKNSQQREQSKNLVTQSITGGVLPKDIYSLINEFNKDVSTFKNKISNQVSIDIKF